MAPVVLTGGKLHLSALVSCSSAAANGSRASVDGTSFQCNIAISLPGSAATAGGGLTGPCNPLHLRSHSSSELKLLALPPQPV